MSLTQMKSLTQKTLKVSKKDAKKIVMLKTTFEKEKKSIEIHNTFLNYVINSSKFTHLNYGIQYLTLKGPIPYIYGTQVWLSLCLQKS